MALLNGLFGQSAPQQAQAPGQGGLGGLGQSLMQLQQTNPEAFIALGSGLLNGNMAQGVSGMGQAIGDYRQREAQAGLQREGWDRQDARFDKTFGLQQQQFNQQQQAMGTERAQQQQQLNASRQWAEATGDPAIIALGAMGQWGEAMKLYQKKNGVSGGASYGKTPVYGQDAQGNTVIGQLGDDGSFIATPMPDGITPLSPYGTSEQRARGTAVGKGMGEAQTELGGTLQTADRNRATGTGASSIFNVIPATGGYDFNQKVKQLQGQAFLQAFESLKGGGQITEVEGMKAEQAIARLSTAQSEQAFEQALTDLKDVVQAGKQRAMQRAGGMAQQPQRGPVNIGGYTIEQVD
jgi:hypothetical protein